MTVPDKAAIQQLIDDMTVLLKENGGWWISAYHNVWRGTSR